MLESLGHTCFLSYFFQAMVDKTKLPPAGCVAVARKEELPAALRPRGGKAAPDALWRKASRPEEDGGLDGSVLGPKGSKTCALGKPFI